MAYNEVSNYITGSSNSAIVIFDEFWREERERERQTDRRSDRHIDRQRPVGQIRSVFDDK